MKSRTVTSDGVKLAVYEQGDPAKPTVLLVHGYPDTHLMWNDVAARLAEDFHVVSYDTRGAGKTGKILVESVQVNPKLDDSRFGKPA